MATIHDRMPVILKPADYGVWLDPQLDDAGALSTLLEAYPTDEMQAEQVSDVVNNACHEVDRDSLGDSSAESAQRKSREIDST